MIRKDPRLDFVEFHILHHAAEAPLYGLWMIEELASHGYRLNASQLYPKFHRLERTGLLNRRNRVVDGKLRKYYRVTAEGRRYLRQQKKKLMELAGEALTADELKRVLGTRTERDRRKQSTR